MAVARLPEHIDEQAELKRLDELEEKARRTGDPRNNPFSPGSPEEVAAYKERLAKDGILNL